MVEKEKVWNTIEWFLSPLVLADRCSRNSKLGSQLVARANVSDLLDRAASHRKSW